MPTFTSSPDLTMHYVVDDYTDPWREPETILMLHGNAESGAAWYAWVPHLARHYRVVRPDMRGFGASTPMPRDFPWTLDVLIDDFIRLMDALGIARFHLVGAKIGGTIARAFAARRPERVLTLTVAGTPPPFREGAKERAPELAAGFAREGVEPWARRSMAGRLGGAFPPEGAEWWTKFMARTAPSTQIGFMPTIACADIRRELPHIACPTLVITTEESGLASVEATRAWQQAIPDSMLLVLPGNSYHVAASDAEKCARATLDFISRHNAARAATAAPSTVAGAGEIRVFTGGSTRTVLDELVPEFEQATGYRVTVSTDPAKIILERIHRGERADLALLGSSAIDELAKQGHIVPGSRRDLARCGAGIGVRAGTPKPDIGTVEAFKRALLAAKSIAHTTSGASGIHFAGVIERLGIARQVKAKAVTQPGGLVGDILARGEAEIAVQQIPELLAVPGVELVGPLPPELQLTTIASAAVFANAGQPEAARALLEYLATPAAARVFRAKGLEPVEAP